MTFEMNSIDAFILVVVCFNLILGAVRGAVWQVLRVASIVLGIWAATRYSDDFLAMWPDSLGIDAAYAPILAQVVVFLSVYLVMYGLTHLVKALVDKVKLGSMDRLMGAGVGAMKGAFFCCVILYLQFTPLGELGIIKNQLYGNEEEGVEPSVANGIFLEFMKKRIDEAVPDSVSKRLRELSDDVTDNVIRPR